MTANHIGKTVYISAAAPATNDAAGFEALSWTQVKGPLTLPQFGVSHNIIDIPDLATGFTSAVKGSGAGVDTSMTFRDVASDAGQAALIAQAVDNDGTLSVKVVTGSGADTGNGPAATTGDPVEYAQGFAHSHQPNQPEENGYEGFSIGFRQNKPTVTGTEP